MLTAHQRLKVQLAYEALPRLMKEKVVRRGKAILLGPNPKRAKMAMAMLTEIRLVEQRGGI